MAVRHVPWISPEEFLDLEERSETKHMYFDGDVRAMAGGTVAHGALIANLLASLHNGLRGRKCLTLGSDVLLQTGPKDLYVYPDAMVICGPVARMEGRPNVVTNPVFVAEVLSSSTEGEDRGLKSRAYRATPSIQQYALLSQDRAHIEIHTRGEDGLWQIRDVSGLEAECEFSALGCRIPMAALYEGIWDEVDRPIASQVLPTIE